MRSTLSAGVLASVIFGTAAWGGPIVVEGPIVEVGLFKNGLAHVRREIALPAAAGPQAGPAEYELRGVPEPVHGTFWIESTVPVTTRVTTREVNLPEGPPSGDLQRELAGRAVTIRMRDANAPPVRGTILEFADPPASSRWNRNYHTGGWEYGQLAWSAPWLGQGSTPVQSPRIIVVQTETGRTWLDTSMIGSIEVDGAARTVRRREPVLVFTVAGAANGQSPGVIRVSYLAKGMSWAPAYHIDLAGGSSLRMRQQAVIRNELADLQNAEILLISGFPNIAFWHVASPLSPGTTLAAFFSELSQRFNLRHPSRGDIVTQQAVMSNEPRIAGVDLSATPAGEGVDLQYHSIGRHTLLEGDSLMLIAGEGTSTFDRVVEWIIPDTRDEFGRPIDDWRREQDPDLADDGAWDAVAFRNPLPFAMTTGPAFIVEGAQFGGQSISRWTDKGEEATLRVTRALSVRTRHAEHEEEGERELVNYGGRTFRKPRVSAEVVVSNHRAEAVTMIIRRRFSGELVEAAGEPAMMLREQGVYAVNRRQELTWTITLQPGESRTLAYRYNVLVPH
jgi:hypothetical protein